MVVADNLQIIRESIRRAVEERNPAPIRELVSACVRAGAEAIDVNPGPLKREPEKKMAFLVGAVREVTDLPLLIDTANPRAVSAGLAAAGDGTIVNGFSLEPEKLREILPLAVSREADIIGFLLRPDGHVPMDAEERLEVAGRLYDAFRLAGGDPARLVVDPVVVPLAWSNGNFQAAEVLAVIRHLPDLLGFPVRTIAGLSNLTSGATNHRRRRLIERAYAAMLAAAGLSMVLVDAIDSETVSIVQASRRLLSQKIFSWEEIP